MVKPVGNPPADGVYNIRDYGAKGDGKTLDTAAINAAITACAKGGGGTVIVPLGEYLSGTIRLRSNLTFHLESALPSRAARIRPTTAWAR